METVRSEHLMNRFLKNEMGFSISSDMSSTMEKITGTIVEIPDQSEPEKVTSVNNCEVLW